MAGAVVGVVDTVVVVVVVVVAAVAEEVDSEADCPVGRCFREEGWDTRCCPRVHQRVGVMSFEFYPTASAESVSQIGTSVFSTLRFLCALPLFVHFGA